MAELLEKYAGVVVAAVFSVVTMFLTQKGNKERDLRIASRDALEAQAKRIEVLQGELADSRRRESSLMDDVRRLRDENQYLEGRLRRNERQQEGL